VKLDFDTSKLQKKIKRATGPKAFIYAAIDLRRAAQRSIKSRPAGGKNTGYSTPGSQPKTAGKVVRYKYIGEKVFDRSEKPVRLLARSGSLLSADKAKRVEKLISKNNLVGQIQKTSLPGLALRKSIQWAVESDKILIGPTATGIGNIGKLHEFGGGGPGGTRSKNKKRAVYAARPFMRPALNQIKAKLPWYLARNMDLK